MRPPPFINFFEAHPGTGHFFISAIRRNCPSSGEGVSSARTLEATLGRGSAKEDPPPDEIKVTLHTWQITLGLLWEGLARPLLSTTSQRCTLINILHKRKFQATSFNVQHMPGCARKLTQQSARCTGPGRCCFRGEYVDRRHTQNENWALQLKAVPEHLDSARPALNNFQS